MRDADAPIFERTREWLEQDGSVFHLIVDELHLYRGTAGTEVAYLLRLLLHRLGLEPGDPKLRILASSASLESDDEKSLRFLGEFFGTEFLPDQIIPGHAAQSLGAADAAPIPTQAFAAIGAALEEGTSQEQLLELACSELGGGPEGPTAAALRSLLESPALALDARMIDACSSDGETRAVELSRFASGLFGTDGGGQGGLAARGLLAARALAEVDHEPSRLPSFRFHLFFRNVEGLWACTSPNCSSPPTSNRLAGRSGNSSPSRRSHALSVAVTTEFSSSSIASSAGRLYLGGVAWTSEAGNGWEILATEPDIEGIPDRRVAKFVEKRLSLPSTRCFGPTAKLLCEQTPIGVSRREMEMGAGLVDGGRRTLTPSPVRCSQATLPPGSPTNRPATIYIVDPDAVGQEFGALPGVCPLRRRLHAPKTKGLADPRVSNRLLEDHTASVEGTLLHFAKRPRTKARAFRGQPRGGSRARERHRAFALPGPRQGGCL